METNLITYAIELAGPARLAGLKRIAHACGLKSYQSVLKWEAAGCLPRTEWTGETNYAEAIEQVTDGKVTRKALLKQRAA
jgi:hypothetical protein